jgi:hypothetical protein
MFQRSMRVLQLMIALGILASSGLPLTAEATPITYSFVSQLPIGTTYGTGSFTFDDSLILAPLPKTVTGAGLTAFSYSDPAAGSFTLANLGSFNFTLGTTPTTSSFAFTAQSLDGLRSFTGGVVDGNNVGGLSTSNSFAPGGGFANPSLRFPIVVPEPSVAVFVGLGLIALANRKRSS